MASAALPSSLTFSGRFSVGRRRGWGGRAFPDQRGCCPDGRSAPRASRAPGRRPADWGVVLGGVAEGCDRVPMLECRCCLCVLVRLWAWSRPGWCIRAAPMIRVRCGRRRKGGCVRRAPFGSLSRERQRGRGCEDGVWRPRKPKRQSRPGGRLKGDGGTHTLRSVLRQAIETFPVPRAAYLQRGSLTSGGALIAVLTGTLVR